MGHGDIRTRENDLGPDDANHAQQGIFIMYDPREQGRGRVEGLQVMDVAPTVLDLIGEYRADCLGWQYQLGLLPLRPPSDFAEGLLNSACRPETNGETVVCSTEADQGNLVPMELLKRLLKEKGLHHAVN